MRTLKGIAIGFVSLILAYVLLEVLSFIFVPEMAPAFNGIFGIMWQVFKAFFAEDILKTIIVAALVAIVFGSISYKKENAIIRLIGGILDLIILFAGFGGK